MPEVMTHEPRWLIYALGGGMGHLTRATALARAARRHNVACSILCNSPFAGHVPFAQELGSSDELLCVPATASRDATARVVEAVLRCATLDQEQCEQDGLLSRLGNRDGGVNGNRTRRWEMLIVDTFPRGLSGELADVLSSLNLPRVLVHRDLAPEYVDRFELRRSMQHYDGVLLPGERGVLGDHPCSLMTEPWLLRDADELCRASEARTRLLGSQPCDGRPIVLVLGCGRSAEITQMSQLAEAVAQRLDHRANVCFTAPTSDASGDNTLLAQDVSSSRVHRKTLWPVLTCLRGVDLLVGAGGYNTVAEARATQTPFVAFARERLYDRQAERLSDVERLADESTLIAAVEQGIRKRANSDVRFTNGVHAAVRFLLRLSAGP